MLHLAQCHHPYPGQSASPLGARNARFVGHRPTRTGYIVHGSTSAEHDFNDIVFLSERWIAVVLYFSSRFIVFVVLMQAGFRLLTDDAQLAEAADQRPPEEAEAELDN